MPPKTKRTVEQYTFLAIRLENFSASVDVGINYEARDPRRQNDDVHVYRFGSRLELEGQCTSPDERTDERYHLTVYRRQPGEDDLEAKLADCHVRHQDGTRKYRKAGKHYVPVYKVPSGLGIIEKRRSDGVWHGAVWIPEHTVTQMLILLTSVRRLYIHIHERKIERKRWINSFALQTTDPAEE